MIVSAERYASSTSLETTPPAIPSHREMPNTSICLDNAFVDATSVPSSAPFDFGSSPFLASHGR
jgi:hypothetical protein